ncbi:MAG: alpha/beta fold hydrolase [Acidimicrobiia bacterium]|nr:alpha/beta fold hydrolase [Acidimicrobiia bacterium]NNL12402.1 alpha/beta fold hydrolase [Acidimicrobiia bacterium]NNL96907.1 alpha/beta fold hydrolase [Acidimicrobiia bacterium]RZV47266.1 MAG: alpha/beta fold hydrolase [Acidimicrobiia bacterium]
MTPDRVTIDGAGDIRLEGRWDRPPAPSGAVVFCHPHPQHGGTMTAPLMHKVTRGLVARGLSVLRFNFRGVGLSTGGWDGGFGEIDDVAAAVARARDDHPDLELGLAGWSFGAATALAWQARENDRSTMVGIAPPVMTELVERLPTPETLAPASRLLIVGDRDQFVTVADLQAYADAAGATVTVLNGSDHFFYFREDRVAELVADHFLTAGDAV